MDMALTGKTKKANICFRFGGLGERGNGVLGLSASRNFYCDNGTVRTVCITPVLLENGEKASYNEADATALQRLKHYNETGEMYSKHFLLTTNTGEVKGQKDVLKNFYDFSQSGIGMGEMISFIDSDFRSWVGVFGDKKCVLIDDLFSPSELSVEKPNGTGCYFKHRLFVATKPSTLVYSAVDNFTNFTSSLNEGGKICFPNVGGEIVAIRSFRGILYLFFEYGILRLDIKGLPKEFSTEKIEYRGGKIYGRTVCVGENAIFFMADDGVYRLDGRGVKEVCHEFVKLPYAETKTEGAATWKGKAFIRYQVDDGRYETLCLSDDGKHCVYLDDTPVLSQEEGGTIIFKNKDCVIVNFCEEGDVYNYDAALRTLETDMGTPKRKLLTKIKLIGKGSCILGIQNGKRMQRRWVNFVDGQAVIHLHDRGENFSFTIDTVSYAEVREMNVEMRLLA